MGNMENVKYQIDKRIKLGGYGKVSFLFIYALFAFYFLINGEGIFKEWNNTWTYTTIIYLTGVSLFLGIQSKLPAEFEKPVVNSVIGFCLCFAMATCLFLVLRDANVLFGEVEALRTDEILGMFVYQMVIVCASEEIIFRGVIYRILRRIGFYQAVFISAFIFSVFHLIAYNFNVSAMMIAFLMGIILAFCVEKWNLGVSIGGHLAWNCMVLGITALV